MFSIIYEDNLVVISEDKIKLYGYYFPTSWSKVINFTDINFITVKEPTIRNGKYRFWGSGDLKTWFPLDYGRNKRDKIFFIYMKTKKNLIGFTVEDSDKVIEVLKVKNLLRENVEDPY